jgi:protein-L-isoaspartate O-methyltransferase
MQAIEFVTQVKNGIIEVPKEYLKALHDECRIIILIGADEHKTTTKKKKKLTSLEVDTRGLFNRDEANER